MPGQPFFSGARAANPALALGASSFTQTGRAPTKYLHTHAIVE